MSAPPPPEPPPAAPAFGAAPGPNTRYLSRPLRYACERAPTETDRNSPNYGKPKGVKPLASYRAANLPNWPGGKAAFENDPDVVPTVELNMQKRLMTVLAAADLGSDETKRYIGQTTIQQFRAKSRAQQIAYINDLWDRVATPHTFGTLAGSMFAPGIDADVENHPLPSSWCPVSGVKGGYGVRCGHGNGGVNRDAWHEFCVGFRVDGTSQSAINRVLGTGMTMQSQNQSFMENFRGQYVAGTAAARDDTPRVWTNNHDIFNETAVCVSRNFFGGTAFPERTTEQNIFKGEFSVIWAVNCAGLAGFDTENVQRGLPGARQWRPGEKAFPFIPADRLIGYAKIYKTGAAASGGWSFFIRDSDWTLCGAGTEKQVAYARGELRAWHGSHTIPGTWDFAT